MLVKNGNTEERVIALLKEKKYVISAAESCTGGLFLATLINVSGASDVIKEGFITYAEEAKIKRLGVKKETLEKYTAVSKQTAREMVEGLQNVTGADVAVSITGLAGPGGGTEDIPVGTVFVGCVTPSWNNTKKMTVKKLQLEGNRLEIRQAAVEEALLLVEQSIHGSILCG